MNNMMANKWNTSGVHDAGRYTSVMNDGAMTTRNPDGSKTFSTGSAQSSAGYSAQLGQNIREEVSDRYETAKRHVDSEAEELANYYSGAASKFSDTAKSVSSGETVSSEHGVTFSEDERSQVSEAWNSVERFAERHGISSDVALQAALAGEAGFGKAAALKLGAQLKASGSLGALSSEQFSTAVEASRNEGLVESLSTLRNASESVKSGSSNASSESANEGRRWSKEEGERRSKSFRSAFETSESLAQANTELQSRGVNYGSQMTDAVIAELREQGMSDGDISAIINPKSLSGIEKQRDVIDDLLPDVLEKLDLLSGSTGSNPSLMENADYYRPVETGIPDTIDTSALELRKEHVDGLHARNTDTMLEAHSSDAVEKKTNVDRVEGNVELESEKLLPEHLADRAAGIVTESYDRLTGDHMQASGATDRGVRGSSEVQPLSMEVTPAGSTPLTPYERDVMVRTVLGEAGGESDEGMAAVAHVIKNRVEDPRWGDDPAEVALGWRQFSAWNAGVGGNDLIHSKNPGDPAYERAAEIVENVYSGRSQDPTGGATHYYSPAGMAELVENGHQTNALPRWLETEQLARGTPDTVIGGHVFTGKVR